KVVRSLHLNVKDSPPTLWDEFDALATVPLMIIRGANSTMLSAETMNGMLARRSELDIVVVADQGHAPLLEAPKLMRRIAAFAASCDAADGGSRPSCGSMDRYPSDDGDLRRSVAGSVKVAGPDSGGQAIELA